MDTRIVVTFQYSTVDSFVADIELIYKNSEQFNGTKSPVTIEARKLCDSCRLQLTNDLIHLGPEKDEYTLLENAIKRK
jgi:hypothetical protein